MNHRVTRSGNEVHVSLSDEHDAKIVARMIRARLLKEADESSEDISPEQRQELMEKLNQALADYREATTDE